MTEKLKTLMHAQADVQDFAVPDVEAMVRAGDRRRRARRTAVVGGVAAAAVGAALVVPALLGSGTGPGPSGTTATDAAPLTWVTGSVLHEGDTEVALPANVQAYVRTTEGYVLADRRGGVWSMIDGEAILIGRIDARQPYLASDDESSLAGWLDASRGYVVLDQATGRMTELGTGPGPFAALDDGQAVLAREHGAEVVDLETGETTPVDGVGDLENGVVAVTGDRGITFQTVAGEQLRALDGGYADMGSFSPDGAYYTYDADEPQVYDVRTGERVFLDVGGRQFATGYEWLGPDTLAVLAAAEADDASTAELLTCEVPEGSCERVAELGTFDAMEETLALPVGIPITG